MGCHHDHTLEYRQDLAHLDDDQDRHDTRQRERIQEIRQDRQDLDLAEASTALLSTPLTHHARPISYPDALTAQPASGDNPRLPPVPGGTLPLPPTRWSPSVHPAGGHRTRTRTRHIPTTTHGLPRAQTRGSVAQLQPASLTSAC